MKIIFNLYSILIILISVMLYIENIGDCTTIMLIAYGIQFLLFFYTFKKYCKRPIQYLRPFFILLLGCIIVNFQGIIDYSVMGYRNFFQEFHYEKYADKCLYLAIIAQTSLTLGYINYRPRFRKSAAHVKPLRINKTFLSTLIVTVFCLFIAFIDINAFLIGDGSKVNNGAADREVGTLSLYSELLLTLLIIVYISTISLNFRRLNRTPSLKTYIKAYGLPFWVVFLAYLFLRLLSGDRGPVIYNLAIFYFGYVYASGYNLPLKWTVVLLVAGAFVTSLIGVARLQSTSLSFTDKLSIASTEFSRSEDKSIIPVTSELAGSGKIAAIAVSAAEERGTLHYGYGKYEISTIILKFPFLSRLILTLNPNARLLELSTSELFTREVLGPHYTYGLGTSAVGEAYLDFYLFGPILVFFIFGMLYKTADVCIIEQKNVSPYLFTILLYMSGYAIYIGRSSFAFVLSGALTAVLIQYLVKTFSSRK